MKILQLKDMSGKPIGTYVTMIQDNETIKGVLDGVAGYVNDEIEKGDEFDEWKVLDELLLKNGIQRMPVTHLTMNVIKF